MTTMLIFIVWLMSLGDQNRSTNLCIVAFIALCSSCTPVTP